MDNLVLWIIERVYCHLCIRPWTLSRGRYYIGWTTIFDAAELPAYMFKRFQSVLNVCLFFGSSRVWRDFSVSWIYRLVPQKCCTGSDFHITSSWAFWSTTVCMDRHRNTYLDDDRLKKHLKKTDHEIIIIIWNIWIWILNCRHLWWFH